MGDAGIVRTATIHDLNSIVGLENKCFDDTCRYSRRQLKYLLEQAHGFSLVELVGDTVRGFIIVLLRHGTTIASIETLNVDPTQRRKGIARRLLAEAESLVHLSNDIHRIKLEVSVNNSSAIRLYEAAGYKKTSILKGYYKRRNIIKCV